MAEELRELRLSKQIPAKDMVAVVQAIYIHYHQLTLPPIYGWKNGYLCGTHPWPARQWTGSIENGWREVYDIDPSIVLAAAEKIDSARAFLKGVQA